MACGMWQLEKHNLEYTCIFSMFSDENTPWVPSRFQALFLESLYSMFFPCSQGIQWWKFAEHWKNTCWLNNPEKILKILQMRNSTYYLIEMFLDHNCHIKKTSWSHLCSILCIYAKILKIPCTIFCITAWD